MNFITGRIEQTGEGAGAGSAFVAAGEALTLALNGDDAARLRGHVGQAVTLGIRPEDLYIAGGADAAGGDGGGTPRATSGQATSGRATSRWTVDVVEPMGNEVVLYAHAGEGAATHSVVARVSPQAVAAPGSETDLALDLGKLHFFDAATGVALTETERAELA